ncbi:diguanylate cyclase [Microvirga sp. TS319]|uniref:sensor domain-containing diguanylate cyclase n=1 Tax=Microvirga sp. TS319 TaxID=3241165 RepID=UPI00351A299C
MPDPIVVLDRNNIIVSCNDLFRHLYEVLPEQDIAGQALEKLIQSLWQRHPEEGGGEHYEKAIRPILQDDKRFAGVAYEVPLPKNRWVRIVEQRSREGLRTCVHFDITRYNRERQALELAESQARAQEARFRAVIERSPVGMSIASDDGTILEANEAYGRFLGYAPRELIGKKLWDFMEPEEWNSARAVMAELVTGKILSLERETRFLHQDGTLRWALQSAVHFTDGGSNGEVISQLQDLTARKHAESERDTLLSDLAYRAAHDGLTGLPNRTAFEDALNSAMKAAQASNRPHALCYLDLDGFKGVNDAAGHVAGDQVLRMVAATLKQHIRPMDFLARLGGDEFGLILYEADLDSGISCVSALIKAVSTTNFVWNDRNFVLGLSVGITKVTSQDLSIDRLLRRADEACYRAKRAGRNLAVVA